MVLIVCLSCVLCLIPTRHSLAHIYKPGVWHASLSPVFGQLSFDTPSVSAVDYHQSSSAQTGLWSPVPCQSTLLGFKLLWLNVEGGAGILVVASGPLVFLVQEHMAGSSTHSLCRLHQRRSHKKREAQIHWVRRRKTLNTLLQDSHKMAHNSWLVLCSARIFSYPLVLQTVCIVLHANLVRVSNWTGLNLWY